MAGKRNIILSVLVRLVVSLALLATAAAIFGLLVRHKPQPARNDQTGILPRVIVMPVRAVSVNRQWEGFGTARAMDTADVPARVTATIVDIAAGIDAGAMVDQGKLLVRLDDADFLRQEEVSSAAIADIDSQLLRIDIELKSWEERCTLARQLVELAEAEYKRAEDAQARGAAKQREVDQARQAMIGSIRDEVGAREEYDKILPRRTSLQAQRLGFESQLRLARQNVERCRITSPLTGFIQSVDVEIGESLSVGQRVARVVDPGRIEIPLRLPAGARSQIRVNDYVTLHATGNTRQSWKARVSRISPVNDETTRTMLVFVEVVQDAESASGLAPGQFVRGVVSSSEPQSRCAVPRRAINSDRVHLVLDGRITSRPVEIDFQVETRFPELGVPDQHWVVLQTPLNDGDQVILNPTRTLREGMRVDPVPYLADGAATASRAREREREESP